MGQVLTAGAGQIPARQAAVAAGIPMDVPALTINKVCLSGLDAIALADQLIRAGEFEIVVAGGQESMTAAPHLLSKSRSGFKYGDVTMVDHMAYDGLFCAFDQVAMGASTEKRNARYGVTRAEQDEFSAASHQRAAAAIKEGRFADEIVAVSIPQRKGDPIVVDTDEGVRADTTVEGLARLRPAFASDGTITAGSSSQISDGAAAVVVCSKEKAEELGLSWIAAIGARGAVAGPEAGRRASRGLIWWVENEGRAVREVAAGLARFTGRARVLGLTGPPGGGKSTATSALIGALRRQGKRIGVLAIDPSSPFSGGALLGDRIRMHDHSTDPGVFIRSMATRGQLGGLAAATPAAVRVLDGTGCDVVLIETVGVGQSEVDIVSLADTTVVLLAPGMGDGIQAAKAGLLEVADVFVVNKADRDGAEQTARDLRHMTSLGHRGIPGPRWRVPIVS